MSNPTGKGGFQERKHHINRNGRPKSFDKFRELARSISHEPVKQNGEPVVIDGHIVTVAEAMLRQLAASKNPRDRQLFIEIAYGKVPAPVELSGKDGGPVKAEVEHRGQVHGSVEHVAAVVAALAGVGAIQLAGVSGGDDAEDDTVHPA